MNPSLLVLIAFVAGLILGVAFDNQTALRFIEPVGTLWISALRMPIIPLILALTISGVASSSDTRQAGTLTMRAILVFFAFLVVYTLVATPMAPLLLSGLELDATSTTALRESVSGATTTAPKLSVIDWFLSLIPANPIKAAADGALLPLVVFSLAYGLALTRATEAVRESQVRFLKGVSDVLILLIKGVLFVAPLGIFALAYALGVRVGAPAASAVAYYIIAVVGALLVGIAVLYLIVLTLGRTSLKAFSAAMVPAQTIAISSRSSLAALPALIDGVRAKLQVRESVAAVVLPIAASIFKLNSAITWSFGAVLVGKLYGVELDQSAWIIFGVGTVLLSFTTPGIPSGGFFVQAPLYLTVGLPPEGIGILIAIDLIPDVFKTALNVTSYGTATVLVDRWERRARSITGTS